ncbi:MAG: hypothetical protein H7Y88_09560 [Phycisphaerales bacterium]|nr:hypothetical protein [Phycisphaerales bacterium]
MDTPLSRRSATRKIVLMSAAGLALPLVAHAQPRDKKPKPASAPATRLSQPVAPATTQPGQPSAMHQQGTGSSVLDKLLKRGREDDWTLKIDITVRPYQHVEADSAPILTDLRFKEAAIVFPVLYGSASHAVDVENFAGRVSFNEDPADEVPDYKDDYQGGSRIAKWTLKDKVGHEMGLRVEIPMTCWETVFDERAANGIKWPAVWSPIAQSTLRPDQPRNRPVTAPIDYMARPVMDLVKAWTDGKNPQAIPPVKLAKFLAGKVQEHVQPGEGEGLEFGKMGQLIGINLQTASETVASGKGSPHDMTNALCAVYRAAGLPARTVIGYDVRENKGEDSGFLKKNRGGLEIKSWVEFALYDEGANKTIWIPVDVVRMRAQGSKSRSLDSAWKYFGTHDELDDVMPISFHYHPPTSVVAHGYPCFWGWLTAPTLQNAKQAVTMSATSTPKGPGEKKKKKTTR